MQKAKFQISLRTRHSESGISTQFVICVRPARSDWFDLSESDRYTGALTGGCQQRALELAHTAAAAIVKAGAYGPPEVRMGSVSATDGGTAHVVVEQVPQRALIRAATAVERVVRAASRVRRRR